MFVIFIRALILFAIVFLVIRLMGKRELSQVQPFEFVIIVLIADLASGPMQSTGVSILNGVIPILVLLIVYIIFTYVIQASNKLQNTVCGRPSLLIVDGMLQEEEIKKQQYTIEEIMSQLRNNNVYKISDVDYAILETNGNINVIKKDNNYGQIPLNVITDGKLCENTLKLLKIGKKDVENMLINNKLNIENVLVGTIDENNKFSYQLKENLKVEVNKK